MKRYVFILSAVLLLAACDSALPEEIKKQCDGLGGKLATISFHEISGDGYVFKYMKQKYVCLRENP